MANSFALSALAEGIEKATSRDPKRRDYFRFSSLGHCPRKQIAERAGLQPLFPFNERSARKMWIGTVLGAETQKMLVKAGFLLEESVEQEVRYKSYKGKKDGTTLVIPGKKLTVEIKTSADDSITRYDWPETYPWQGLGYALGDGHDGCWFIQLGTSYGLARDKVMYLTDEWKRKIDTHIKAMDRMWEIYEKTEKLPKCYHRFGWENKLCPYLEKKEKIVENPPAQPAPGEPELGEDADEDKKQERIKAND